MTSAITMEQVKNIKVGDRLALDGTEREWAVIKFVDTMRYDWEHVKVRDVQFVGGSWATLVSGYNHNGSAACRWTVVN